MPHDVFLSYASADRAAADAVCAALEARGIRCWIAPRDVPAGADWGEAILTAIGRAHAMVLVLSRQTAGSVHVRNEVVTAVSQSLALVPVRVEDCQPGGALRLHLAGSHWLNVFPPPIEQHADALAGGVRLALAADATIEIPRAQAAALVAAARAGMARGPVAPSARAATAPALPVAPPAATAAARPAATPPARPAAKSLGRPAATASALQGAALPAPHVATPGRGRGVALAIGAIVLALLGALGAAWLYEPRLRAMFGAAPSDAPAVAGPSPDAALPVLAAGTPSDAAPPAPAVPPSPAVAPPPGGLAAAPGPLAGLGALAPLPLPAAPAPFVAPAPPAPPTPPRSMAIAPPPRAPATTVPPARLLNAASATISRLFVAPAGEGVGREDWLGNAQITPGNAVLLRPPAGQGCLFNIRVVYVGGRTEDRPGVDLCAAPELRFEGSKGAGGSSPR